MKTKTLKHLNTKLVGILRTKLGTTKENTIRAIQTAFDTGVELIEITSNSEHWQDVVKECVKKTFNIGVGSIKNLTLAKEAISLSAKFLVSPGFFEDVVILAKENNIPILPGIYLEEELELAKEYKVKDVKFFPASVTTHEDFFKAIKEPFRDEFNELEDVGFKIISYDSTKEYKNHIFIKSPTQFYKLYSSLSSQLVAHSSNKEIIIKLPDGELGFDRLKDFANKLQNYNIHTYAVGGVNDKNMKEILTKYDAYGVCPGSGMFNADAIFNGDFERVKSDVKKYVEILKETLQFHLDRA